MKRTARSILSLMILTALILSACGAGNDPTAAQTAPAGTTASAVISPTQGGQAASTTAAPAPTAAPVTGADATAAERPSAAETAHAADPEENKTENTGSLRVSTDTADGCTVDGDVYTITKAGTYTFSGSSENGQIVVDAGEEKVEIVLDGLSLSCGTDAPIKALAADKLTLKAEKDSYNEITDTRPLRSAEEALTESEEKSAGGAIYAKCDLTLSGKGTLVVTGSFNNGVHCTKDLKVKNLTLKVTAPNNALKGNDSVEIESGSLLLISTGGDGIKTEDSDISAKGNQRGSVTFAGGVTDIYAACDGIDAAYDVEISGEETVLNVYTDKYSPHTGEIVSSGGEKAYLILLPRLYNSYKLFAAYYYNDDRENGVWSPAAYDRSVYSGRTEYFALSYTKLTSYENVAFFAFEDTTASLETYAAATSGGAVHTGMNAFYIKSIAEAEITGDYIAYSPSGESVSAKGIKADNAIRILAGTVTVQSTDDAVHANNDVLLADGTNGAGDVTVSGGSLTLSSGDDGIHADNIVTIDGGSVDIVSAYEGIEGNQVIINGGAVWIYGKDDGINATRGAVTPLIQVNGGSLQVTTASGDTDGLDSNGNYVQTGGFVLVMGGSTMGGVAGSVDVDGSVSVTGGTIIALGGICETPGSGSCCTVVISGKSFSAGTYTVNNGSEELISFTLTGNYSNAWIASDRLAQGGSYQLLKNGSDVYSWSQDSQSVGGGGSKGGMGPGGGGGWGPGGGRR